MRIRRRGLAAALMPIVLGSAAALAVDHAPTSHHPADRLAANLAAARSTVVVNCQGSHQVRPATLMMACDDGNAYLSGLHWTAWQSSATASGTWRINDCVPDCAAGTFHTFTATVRLWQPGPLPSNSGTDYYSKIAITLPHGHCYTAAGRQGCYPATYTGSLHATG
jgi:hypothetical protein